ncbi:LOW QUALITY PROTEIN: DNA polymerase zeta processivity subunit [Drosophila eugracilis]|uniref:LOW QUALITY PROTEIN: DNA polymerase zeta processivity subunit n=1 Tax=Drosophila eugracilis TaxID=29029 RepID=UPI001BD9B139|nr:LOW QUALITY PROTEIN: DNA polymerase zeta processivity subunit [Drosophila eugracilis]
MQVEIQDDVIVEAMEVLINHILYGRGVYPSHIFKKKRVYNTPVFISIFPPLNNYLAGVLRSAQELICRRELQCLEIIVYHDDSKKSEIYKITLGTRRDGQSAEDCLLHSEQQLRSAIYKISERLNQIPKPAAGRCHFKIHLHTTQEAFIRLSHEAQYQEFPWIQAYNPESQLPPGTASLLPLTTMANLGLRMEAVIHG